MSVCADVAAIKQAAGQNSANRHDLQHQVLSGQAARRAEVCLCVRICVRTCMHTVLRLLMITSQVTMQKILHIPEKYSLFPNIHQGIKSKMTPPLPCLPNQGKIILLNSTKSSDGVKWQHCLGGCAEFGNCLKVSIQLLMLYLFVPVPKLSFSKWILIEGKNSKKHAQGWAKNCWGKLTLES